MNKAPADLVPRYTPNPYSVSRVNNLSFSQVTDSLTFHARYRQVVSHPNKPEQTMAARMSDGAKFYHSAESTKRSETDRFTRPGIE